MDDGDEGGSRKGIGRDNSKGERRLRQTESTLGNPIFLSAFAAAIVAALANAFVAYSNNNTLLGIETNKENEELALQVRKENEEQSIEAKKAEFSRLLEISKLDLESARQKLKAFVDMGLITDSNIRVGSLTASQSGGASRQPQTNASTSSNETVPWDSEWVSGGHNQDEMCTKGISALAANDKYKGKSISRLYSSEDSRKDIFGHVEYKYHCTYMISAN